MGAQKNVQYAVNSFLGKAANGTLSTTEQPFAAALGLGLQQKYLQQPFHTNSETRGGSVGGGVSVKSAKSANALCEVCSKPANFLCSGCELVYYCTTSCQRESWATHYKLCVTKRAEKHVLIK